MVPSDFRIVLIDLQSCNRSAFVVIVHQIETDAAANRNYALLEQLDFADMPVGVIQKRYINLDIKPATFGGAIKMLVQENNLPKPACNPKKLI